MSSLLFICGQRSLDSIIFHCKSNHCSIRVLPKNESMIYIFEHIGMSGDRNNIDRVVTGHSRLLIRNRNHSAGYDRGLNSRSSSRTAVNSVLNSFLLETVLAILIRARGAVISNNFSTYLSLLVTTLKLVDAFGCIWINWGLLPTSATGRRCSGSMEISGEVRHLGRHIGTLR